jgi:hypothetical protein
MTLFSTILDRHEDENNDDTDDQPTLVPTLLHSPASSFGNAVVEQVESEWFDRLDYRAYVCAFENVPMGRDPFEARNKLQTSKQDWRAQLREEVSPDLNSAVVPFPVGGAGAVAHLASPFPESRVGRPVVNIPVLSHKLRRGGDNRDDAPAPREAINAAIEYQLFDERDGHIICSHLIDRHGKEATVDKFAELAGVLPRLDLNNIGGGAYTAWSKELDVGQTLDSLHDKLSENIVTGHQDPFFDPADWKFWAPVEDVRDPLQEPQAGRAMAVVPERFEGEHVDIEVQGAPDIDQHVFAPVDNAFLVVLRGVDYGFIEELQTESLSWLRDQLHADTMVGEEWRRLCRRQPTPQDHDEMLDSLLTDLETVE